MIDRTPSGKNCGYPEAEVSTRMSRDVRGSPRAAREVKRASRYRQRTYKAPWSNQLVCCRGEGDGEGKTHEQKSEVGADTLL